MKINWGDIEKSIETLRKVDGGFSSAHRGIVTLSDALHWMTGFWFKAAATPIWPGGPAHLRDVQLQSAITARKLAGIS